MNTDISIMQSYPGIHSQAAALPHALAGRDVLGQAATGSGKTAVFGLAALQQLDLSPGARGNSQPQVLVEGVCDIMSGVPAICILSSKLELAHGGYAHIYM